MDENQHNNDQQDQGHQDQPQYDDNSQGQYQDQGQQNDQPAAAAPETDQHLTEAKKRALAALVPLMGDLEVDPEQKFNMCMNAIRSTDNKELVPAALDAALAIEDKRAKAEALVELVNEINYLQQPVS